MSGRRWLSEAGLEVQGGNAGAADTCDYLSHSLNSLKGGYTVDYILSHSLNSLKGGYVVDYIGDYGSG